MALIKCPECGGKISDKAPACIHCGYPMSLIDGKSESITISGVNDTKTKDIISNETGYSVELLDYGNKKIQIATVLKSALKMKDVEALELVASAPCYLFTGKKESVIQPIIQKLDSLPVEYKLYVDGNLKRHKKKIEVNRPHKMAATSSVKKITCPNCSSLIAESVRVCPECGLDGIGSYLLQLEKEKQSKYIDYTRGYEIIDNSSVDKNVPKCPKCGSSAITAGQRGFSFFTGFIGSSKTMNRCANCGNKWNPGK